MRRTPAFARRRDQLGVGRLADRQVSVSVDHRAQSARWRPLYGGLELEDLRRPATRSPLVELSAVTLTRRLRRVRMLLDRLGRGLRSGSRPASSARWAPGGRLRCRAGSSCREASASSSRSCRSPPSSGSEPSGWRAGASRFGPADGQKAVGYSGVTALVAFMGESRHRRQHGPSNGRCRNLLQDSSLPRGISAGSLPRLDLGRLSGFCGAASVPPLLLDPVRRASRSSGTAAAASRPAGRPLASPARPAPGPARERRPSKRPALSGR